MNLKNLRNSFGNTDSEQLSNFIQSARVNEELQKMNEEITFDKFKAFLHDIFKNHRAYKLFNREAELAKKYDIVIPRADSYNYWNAKAYTYFNFKKQAFFCALPAMDEAAKFFNVDFYILQNGENLYHERISFANQLTDVRDKIEFHLTSIEFKPDVYKKTPTIAEQFVTHPWFEYINTMYYTDDCVKKDSCKKKCKNCDKCKSYLAMRDAIQTVYNANMIWHRLISTICHKTNLPVAIDFNPDSHIWTYTIGKLTLELSLPIFKKSQAASLTIFAADSTKHNVQNPEFKQGHELTEIIFWLLFKYGVSNLVDMAVGTPEVNNA